MAGLGLPDQPDAARGGAPEPLLRAEGVCKCYREGDRRNEVLRRLDFELHRGECVALLGRSGSGKSTLLNLLAGIDQPDAGRILLDGRDIGALGEPQRTLLRRRHIGFIYQVFNLLPTLTVAENVALPLELNGRRTANVRRRVAEILEQVSLTDRNDAFPDQLSGGEQQRVAIARALVHEPDIVLADEPTGNLDARTGAQVLALLDTLFRGPERCLILVTHSLQVAALADRILTLEDGMLRGGPERFAW